MSVFKCTQIQNRRLQWQFKWDINKMAHMEY